jgi:hypothetical protein
MFDVADTLLTALSASRGALQTTASAAARAQTPLGSGDTDRAMAGVAEHALFTEALLSAMHARLAEIKTAAR